jgi:hypothetical protein
VWWSEAYRYVLDKQETFQNREKQKKRRWLCQASHLRPLDMKLRPEKGFGVRTIKNAKKKAKQKQTHKI